MCLCVQTFKFHGPQDPGPNEAGREACKEVTLVQEAGDLLFIPPGWFHSAVPETGGSGPNSAVRGQIKKQGGGVKDTALCASVVTWYTSPIYRAESVLRYVVGQVEESQAGAEFPARDREYAESLPYTPHPPAPVKQRFIGANLFNHGAFNTGAVPTGTLGGHFHPKYPIQ